MQNYLRIIPQRKKRCFTGKSGKIPMDNITSSLPQKLYIKNPIPVILAWDRIFLEKY